MFQLLRLGINGSKLQRSFCKIKTPQIPTDKSVKSLENKKNEDEKAKLEECESNEKPHKTLTEQEKLLMGVANVDNQKPSLHIFLTPDEQSLLSKQNVVPSDKTNVSTTDVCLQDISTSGKPPQENSQLSDKTLNITNLNLSSIDISTSGKPSKPNSGLSDKTGNITNLNLSSTDISTSGKPSKENSELCDKSGNITNLNLSSIDVITNKIFKTTNESQKDTTASSSEDNLPLDKKEGASENTFKIKDDGKDREKSTNDSQKDNSASSSKDKLPLDKKEGAVCLENTLKIRDDGNNGENLSEKPITTTNIPRIVRQEPGKVVCCVIPVEWPTFFHKATGITGFYTFGFTFSTYLISKEIYVMEHEYYTGLSMAILCIAGVKYLGPTVAETLDGYIDEYEALCNNNSEGYTLEEHIKEEEQLQINMAAQLMLFDAKRENILFQLEENFRERQMIVYNEVKKRLDYFSALEDIQRRFLHLNMAHWVTQEVLKAITPELEEKKFQQCIEKLESVAKKNV